MGGREGVLDPLPPPLIFNYSKEALGGARTIIEGVASTGWVSDARVETTTHFYTSRVW